MYREQDVEADAISKDGQLVAEGLVIMEEGMESTLSLQLELDLL